MSDPELDTVARHLRSARRVLFVTGAGLSADSGLPTYRGVGGLYEGAGTADGLPIEVALSGDTMRRDPALCWRYIAQIEKSCRGARPNRGHAVIAALEARCAVTVLTQNVDGLHLAAGSTDVVEIHGNVRTLLCTGCARSRTVTDYAGLAFPPACTACGAVLRPDVVLFGEWLPAGAVARLHRALAEPYDVVFSVGTTSVFPYISTPVVDQVRSGGVAVEINPGDSGVSRIVTHRLRAGAARALGALWDRLEDA